MRLATWLGLILGGLAVLGFLLSLPGFDAQYAVLFFLGFSLSVLAVIAGFGGLAIRGLRMQPKLRDMPRGKRK